MHPVTRFLPASASSATALALVCALVLPGCSTLDSLMAGDKIDYRTSSATKTSGLEVPPDLTQLTRDSRYQPVQGGAVSAAAYQAGTVAASPATVQAVAVAAQSAGEVRIERLGNERWVRTGLSPEQLWPQLQAFWKERGFVIVKDTPTAGVMETDWARTAARSRSTSFAPRSARYSIRSIRPANSTSSAPASSACRAAAARSTSRTAA